MNISGNLRKESYSFQLETEEDMIFYIFQFDLFQDRLCSPVEVFLSSIE